MDSHQRYVLAAISLATSVSVDREMRDNPSAPGDRSVRAAQLRAEMFEQQLTEFWTASKALD